MAAGCVCPRARLALTLLLLCGCAAVVAAAAAGRPSDSVDVLLDRGQALLLAGEAQQALDTYDSALRLDPRSVRGHVLRGELLVQAELFGDAATAAATASALAPGDAGVWSLLGDIKRAQGDAMGALEDYTHAVEIEPEHGGAMAGLAKSLLELGAFEDARVLFESLADRFPEDETMLMGYIRTYVSGREWDTVLHIVDNFIMRGKFWSNPALLGEAYFAQGIAYYHLGKLAKAMDAFPLAMATNPALTMDSLVNLGACYHLMGKLDQALELYSRARDFNPNDARVYNNMGAIYNIQLKDKLAFEVLNKSLQLDPAGSSGTLVNLATLHAGVSYPADLELAKSYYLRAYQLDRNDGNLVRAAIVLPMIIPSMAQVHTARREIEASIDDLLSRGLRIQDIPRDVEYTPFSLQYHGFNDRRIMEKFSTLLFRACPSVGHISPHLIARAQAAGTAAPGNDPSLINGQRKIRVGFLSKFFTMEHAHGELLKGVVVGLNRQYFTVVMLPIANPQQYLNPDLIAAADETYYMSLSQIEGQRVLSEAALDILVFADQMSEPQAYTYNFGRFAAVQVVFWGNPVSPGHIDSSDAFMSADVMEIDKGQLHYTEQLLRVDGQGIWYDPIRVPPQDLLYNRARYSLSPDWVIFACPQSNFKLHPSFDAAAAAILNAIPNARLLMVEDRRESWSIQLQTRMKETMGPAYDRVIFYPRAPNSDAFLAFISVADVMLHPFPFDGSKTAADAFALGIPTVTWPSDFLRGRMGHSFYHSIGFLDLVAHSAEEYVSIAVRLGKDPIYRRRCAHIIQSLSPVIWQREEVVAEWELYLLTSVSYSLPVRTKARERLYAIQRSDEATLTRMQDETLARLDVLDAAPLPLPTPPPPRLVNADPEGYFSPQAPALEALLAAVTSLISDGSPCDAALIATDALTAAEIDRAPPTTIAVARCHLAQALLECDRQMTAKGTPVDGLATDALAHANRLLADAPTFGCGYSVAGSILVSQGRLDDARNVFDMLRSHTSSPCQDSVLVPALHSLLAYGGPLGIDAAATLLIKACSIPPSITMLTMAACLADAAPPLGSNNSSCEAASVGGVAMGMIKQRWMDRGSLSGTIATPTDGEVLWDLTSMIRAQAPLAASIISRQLNHFMWECAVTVRRLSNEREVRGCASQAPPAPLGPREIHVVTVYAGGCAPADPRSEAAIARDAGADAIARMLHDDSITRVHVLSHDVCSSQGLLYQLTRDGWAFADSKLVRVVLEQPVRYDAAFAYARQHAAGSLTLLLLPGVHVHSQSTAALLGTASLPARAVAAGGVLALTAWRGAPWGSASWVPQGDVVDGFMFVSPLCAPGGSGGRAPLAEDFNRVGVEAILAQPQGVSAFSLPVLSPGSAHRVCRELATRRIRLHNPALAVQLIKLDTSGAEYGDGGEGIRTSSSRVWSGVVPVDVDWK